MVVARGGKLCGKVPVRRDSRVIQGPYLDRCGHTRERSPPQIPPRAVDNFPIAALSARYVPEGELMAHPHPKQRGGAPLIGCRLVEHLGAAPAELREPRVRVG